MAIGVRGLSVLAGAVIAMFVGRFLGAEALGKYAIATQTGQLVSVIGLFGLDIAVVRQFSNARANGVRVSHKSLLLVSGIATACLVSSASLLIIFRQIIMANFSSWAVQNDIFLIVALIIIGRGGARFFGAFLRSQGSFNLGQSIEVLVVPLLTCLFCVLLLFEGAIDISMLLLANGIIGIGALLLGGVISFTKSGSTKPVFKADLPGLFASALPLWGVAIIGSISDWYALTVAASRIDLEAAGAFRVAAQVVMAMQVVSIAIFNLYTPKIATAFHKEDIEEVGKLARTATLTSAAFAIPISLILLVFSEAILSVFGSEFQSVAPVLQILVIGQFAFTLTGPSGLSMAMAGYERTNFLYNAIAILILLAVAPIAAESWGLEGLAVAISISILFKNVAAWIWLRFHLGINCLTGTVSEINQFR
ncbi:oligosaccharide flippase family protein [Qipengyuania mesophila]|uniref:oligosaccharide flippase family protein n=1 Tax=Qipengyuania mesophila TaxID=2867246 RepID=UPI003511BAA1